MKILTIVDCAIGICNSGRSSDSLPLWSMGFQEHSRPADNFPRFVLRDRYRLILSCSQPIDAGTTKSLHLLQA